eukprot:TRINITY_DN3273_c0_g1_i1.p1 TRINITY_DN3273_c0_g1~~TRINITY_DN3273_c0_g1_i1.p1  ORF type:complete len:341 (-),score=48.88 TRINITY_DN3273_c0_g1_i1:273-1295(-)
MGTFLHSLSARLSTFFPVIDMMVDGLRIPAPSQSASSLFQITRTKNLSSFRCRRSIAASALQASPKNKKPDGAGALPFREKRQLSVEKVEEVLPNDEDGCSLPQTENIFDSVSEEDSSPSLPVLNTNIEFPPGRRPLVKQAEFIKSSSHESQCPTTDHPEFAVVGRSNVGKSSLINMLVGRKGLALTSKKPGKTQLINHFLINGSWFLVDLPGHGYAKAPTDLRDQWIDFTQSYLAKRESLVAVFLLVDSTIPPQVIDIECADWMKRKKVPVVIVFTKCDKKKKAKNGGRPPHENATKFLEELSEYYPQVPQWIMTSSVTGQGKEELLRYIAMTSNVKKK